jgi:ribonucleoside-diphosphate reductase alpha chain
MTGVAYATSAEMAKELGPSRLQEERRAHAARDPQPPPRRARPDAMKRAVNPVPLDHACPQGDIVTRAARLGRRSALGEQHGYRNAQTTVVAPTGTIGLVMDCDTTGIEPDFALVKFKKLAGGGYFKIINRACRKRCARSAIAKRDRRDRSLCRRPRLAGRRRASTPRP